MKLSHIEINHVFDFDIPAVNTLVIENRPFLRELLQDINAQLSGNSGTTVLSIRDEPVEFSRYAELISDFVPFTMNRKQLMTKLTAAIEKEAMDSENYMRSQELLQWIENYITELTEELPCEIACTKLSILSVLKAAGLELYPSYGNMLEPLLDYMELVRTLDRDKLFILVNLRSYYDDAETAALLRSLLDHDFRVLMIESTAHSPLPNEQRWTIDSDLCEF